MGLSIDMRKIARARVVPWEEGEWAIAWVSIDGQEAADPIGDKDAMSASPKASRMRFSTAPGRSSAPPGPNATMAICGRRWPMARGVRARSPSC